MPGKSKKGSESYQENHGIIEKRIVDSILNSISGRDHLILKLLYETGINLNELTELIFEDIDFQNHSIIIRGRKPRTLSISCELSLQLRNYARPGYLFSTQRTRKMHIITVRKILSRISCRFGADVSARRLRRSFAVEESKQRPVDVLKQDLGINRLDSKKILTKEQFEIIKRIAGERLQSLILWTLVETGCTAKQLVSIRFKDFSDRFLILGKDSRRLPISGALYERIVEFTEGLSPESFVFRSRQSEQLTEKRVYQIVREFGRSSGIHLSPQLIRNSYIAYNIAAGKPAAILARETGIAGIRNFHLYGVFKHD